MNVRSIRTIVAETKPDLIYLNSFFSPPFSVRTLALHRARLIPRIPVLMAPRGELAPGALALKRPKKLAYLQLVKSLGLCRNIHWHASSAFEAAYIHDWFGSDARVHVAPNLAPPLERLEVERTPKVAGSLKVSFLARLSRNKNLSFALESLKKVRGSVEFHVYGPPEDAVYRAECDAIARSLPPSVQVIFHGAVSPDQVASSLGKTHLFFLPTMGENFGHAIFEALRAGCPVLLSDMTPWRKLEEAGVGWDLPLARPEQFQAVLQRCIDMDGVEHKGWEERAIRFAEARGRDTQILDQNRAMFRAVIGR